MESVEESAKAVNGDMDWHLYQYRHLVENAFAHLKHFRCVARGYDKLKRNFASVVALAYATRAAWINSIFLEMNLLVLQRFFYARKKIDGACFWPVIRAMLRSTNHRSPMHAKSVTVNQRSVLS